jgi:hypothetical protein
MILTYWNSNLLGNKILYLNLIFFCVQGNQRNQAVVFDNKVCDYMNHILRVGKFHNCDMKEVRKVMHVAL